MVEEEEEGSSIWHECSNGERSFREFQLKKRKDTEVRRRRSYRYVNLAGRNSK